ncbi:hypothetical protein MKW94_003024 [Papaver nudicaule]|uniref:Uncharacterized protein n=1 Tax=Papaver nudicaule TaxID=74823 RepID=A0AA41VDP0_PAPNU|nr:hypothetical protein [Papaver nudicaule]
MLTSSVPEIAIGGKKDLNIPDLHAHTAKFSECQSESSEDLSDSSSEESEEDYDGDNLSDRSLSDYHPEDDLYTAPKSKDSEDSDDLQQSPPPTKKRREETDPAEKYLGGCEAVKPSTFKPMSDLSSQFVPWLSKSSDCEYIIPDKKSWIKSWSSESSKERKGFNYLDVYGFYKTETGMGGYGVILRDPCGKPVTASASVQPKGKSFFFHVLDGVRAGLELALQQNRYDLRLMFNSVTLDSCLRYMFETIDNGLCDASFTRYACGTCDKCLRFVIPLSDNEFVTLVGTLRKIIDLRSKIMEKSRYFRVTNDGSVLNMAAYHLAKQHARNRKTKTEPKTELIEPISFDKELQKILYQDAYVGPASYSEQLQSKKYRSIRHQYLLSEAKKLGYP